MSARLADRQIRAAALQAAPTLNVRGPVSEALGRAGIAVPPAAPSEAAPTPPEPAPRPALARKTVGGVAAPEPVVKPFEAAPWPTRAGRSDDPARALSGLTVDERRVHRILLDSLEREQTRSGGAGLSYLETKRLAVLDLAFINAQLSKMERHGPDGARVGGLVGGALGLLGGAFGLALDGAGPLVWGLMLVLGFVLLAVMRATTGGASLASDPRYQIYEALRELALLVDDAPVSHALETADRLIDQMAESTPPSATPRSRVRT